MIFAYDEHYYFIFYEFFLKLGSLIFLGVDKENG